MKAVIFDLDGTITELTLPLDAMRQDTKEFFILRGYPRDLFDPTDGISSSTQKAREYFCTNGLSKPDWDEMQAELDKILSAHENWAATNADVIEGALETVKELRERGLKTAILTNNSRQAVNAIMEHIPLGGLFDIIQTRHESPNPKPFPDGLLILVDLLGVSLRDVVYVGDARIDGAAAQRAGMEFWGILSGETDAQNLFNAGASKVFNSIGEIVREVDARLNS
ncbi:MAG: HAD family hydrolase [Promethearchaeota archaeon]